MSPLRAILIAAVLGGAMLPATALQRRPPPIEPHEYLGLFDINAKTLAKFTDGEPLDAAQRDTMLLILFRLRQYSRAALDQYSLDQHTLAAIESNPAEFRGELRDLKGQVTRVEREGLDADERQRLGFDVYYRSTMKTDTGQSVVIDTLAVPAAWKIGELIDERTGAKAMFLKRLPAQTADDKSAEAAGPLLFVAPRVAWYPANRLGKLGMDLGLLDDVRDRAGLDEREAFYQLLAAVRRADQSVLLREARQEVLDWVGALRKQVDDASLDAKERSAARRELARAELGSSDVVPLFNEPASQRGRLVMLRGEALRAVEIRVDDPDVRSRFGIDHYYEVDVVTTDSQNNPLVCVVAELPQGMPLGDDVHESVRIVGFFLKSWAYRLGSERQDRAKQQLAPLVIAGSLQWFPAPADAQPATLTVVGAVVGIAAASALVAWWLMRRADRRHLEAARAARSQLPQRISFEE